MNIFYVDPEPVAAAQALCDRHVVKMTLETAQLLSTAHVILDGKQVAYKAAFINHPCAVWTRQSNCHYIWLRSHFLGLLNEYNFRYNKLHKCEDHWHSLFDAPANIQNNGWTDPPLCMPEEYQVPGNTVLSYINYYKHGKAHLHKWTRRRAPLWVS